MERTGHFGGSLLLYFGILYLLGWGGDTIETIGVALVAALAAAYMSVKPDRDNFAWGIFHRTWITHSLTTVAIATGATYLAFDSILHAGWIAMYMALAIFSATLSHVLLDSLTKGGVPIFGPFDNTKRGLRKFKSNDVLLNCGFLVAGIAMAAIYFGILRISV